MYFQHQEMVDEAPPTMEPGRKLVSTGEMAPDANMALFLLVAFVLAFLAAGWLHWRGQRDPEARRRRKRAP